MPLWGENLRGPASDLALCLQSLVEEGRVAVPAHSSGLDDADPVPLLQKLDAGAREAFALELPAFSVAAAPMSARSGIHLTPLL